MAERKVILAGDIGGTKTYLAAFVRSGERLELVKEEKFTNSEFASPGAVVEGFLKAGGFGGVESACMGIAGAVERNRCTLTNISWKVDGAELGERFSIARFEIINDLAAIAYGVGILEDEDLYVLQSGERRDGNAALIAAGTGLGEAMLFWDGSTHHASASEGGHADFAPRGALEVELLGFLADIYGHVSYERVLSGPGLENIYKFFLFKRGSEMPARMKERFEIGDGAAAVSEGAAEGSDAVCSEAMKLFISIYGAEAGNLALKCLAVNGVYVGGGIAPKILDALKGGTFIDSFIDKGRFSELLSRVPVYVILNDRAALSGAAAYAAGLVQDQVRITRVAK